MDNIAPLVVNIYLGLRPREILILWVQYLSIFHADGWNIYNIHTVQARICTPLIVSRSLRSLPNTIFIYIYLITLILRNVMCQLQCISANAAGTSAIPITDE